MHFYAGDIIFREERPGHEAYIVDQGLVEIFTGPEGNPTVLARVGPNSIFGEMALVSDKPRSASARALTETVCFVVKESDFRARLDESGRFSDTLIRVLAENVRSTSELLSSREADLVARERELQQRELILAEQSREIEEKERQVAEAEAEYERLLNELRERIEANGAEAAKPPAADAA